MMHSLNFNLFLILTVTVLIFILNSFQSLNSNQFINNNKILINKINNDNSLPWSAGINKLFKTRSLSEQPWLINLKNLEKPLKTLKRTLKTRNDYKTQKNNLPLNYDVRKVYGSKCPSTKQVYQQGKCGDCYIFGTMEQLSDRLCIESNGKFNSPLSIQQVLNCNNIDNKCGGGSTENVLNWVHYFGSITQECAGKYLQKPDKCNQLTCKNGQPQKRFYFKKRYYIPNNQYKIMEEIVKRGSVTASFNVYSDFQHYKNGVYVKSKDPKNRLVGGHCISIIGFGETEDKKIPYWIVKNSWGSDWGKLNGTFLIIRGQNECGIEEQVMAAEGISFNPPKKPTKRPIGLKTYTAIGEKTTEIILPSQTVKLHTYLTSFYDSYNKQIRNDECEKGPSQCSYIINKYNEKKSYSLAKYFNNTVCNFDQNDDVFIQPSQILPNEAVFLNYTGSNGDIVKLYKHSYQDQQESFHNDFYFIEINDNDNDNESRIFKTIESRRDGPVTIKKTKNFFEIIPSVDYKMFDVSKYICTKN